MLAAEIYASDPAINSVQYYFGETLKITDIGGFCLSTNPLSVL
jgi:hypothetical protein